MVCLVFHPHFQPLSARACRALLSSSSSKRFRLVVSSAACRTLLASRSVRLLRERLVSSKCLSLTVRTSVLQQSCVELVDEGNEGETGYPDIESESLELLEWSSICQQISRFSSTPLGKDICRKGIIPFGQTQDESQQLLEQTESALFLPSALDFSDIVDISGIIKSATAGAVCNAYELNVVGKMLSAAKRILDQLKTLTNVSSANENVTCTLSPLVSIMDDANFCTSLVGDIKGSIDDVSLSILDTASPSLATIRASRRENMKKLESLLLEAGEMVVAAAGMDSVIITTRRSRQCIAVRTSHKHLLPGAVVLDFSNSGATLFMEPKTAVELNNNEVQLSSQEKEEEFVIMETLTCKLAFASEDILALLHKVTKLDLACAKAGHAKWLNSVKPVFYCDDMSEKDELIHAKGSSEFVNAFHVYIEGLYHPSLLGPVLLNPTDKVLPVPVDFKIKSGVSVVIVSGPNTGGKTASMKTLGVSVLMAKAGLFLPANGKAIIPWFDKVLADIGDSQSLEKSLSTFSGHVQRVCRIMETGTCHSLVLLDELGSGTDPSEGAALAEAILDFMAENVQLSIATTHFSQLSKTKNRSFDVASVEFDIKTLQPKYSIQWGIVGQSNALNIASSLGMDENILARARHWMGKLATENQALRANEIMEPLMKQRSVLQSQASYSSSMLAEATKLHDELSKEANGLEMRLAALRLQQEENVKRDIESAKSHLDEIVSDFQNSLQKSDISGDSTSIGQTRSAIASVIETFVKKYGVSEKNDAVSGTAEKPLMGDLVLIKRLGKNLATVIEVPSENDDSFLVRLGNLKLRAKTSEVTKIVRQIKSSDETKTKVDVSKAPEQYPPIEFHSAAIQTSKNTVDLRGMYVDDALVHLNLALHRRRRSVLFVVHGEGTGALRTAILKELRRHPLVLKFEQESPVNYGCTVVHTK